MPTLKQLTAGGAPAVQNLNNTFPVNDYSGLNYFGKSLQDLGGTGVVVGSQLKREETLLEKELIKNRERINIGDMEAVYAARMAEAKRGIKNPQIDANGNITKDADDPFTWAKNFMDQEAIIREDVLKAAISPNVALAFRHFLGKKLPGEIEAISAEAEQQTIATQRARIIQQLDTDAVKIGEELNPEVRDSMMNSSSAADILKKSQRLFKPEEAVKILHAWKQKIQESYMRTVADKLGYEELSLRMASGEFRELDSQTRFAIANQSRAQAEHVDNLQIRADKKIQDATNDYYKGLAYRGELGIFKDQFKAGVVPGLTQEQQAHIYNIKPFDDINKKEGREAVDQIMINFDQNRYGEVTPYNYKKVFAAVRKDLEQLELQFPQGSHEIQRGTGHFRALEDKLEAELRAEGATARAIKGDIRADKTEIRSDRGAELREVAAKRAKMATDIQRALDRYRANVSESRSLVDFTRQRDKIDRHSEENKIRLGIFEGRDPKEITDEMILKGNARMSTISTPPQQKIDSLKEATPKASPIDSLRQMGPR